MIHETNNRSRSILYLFLAVVGGIGTLILFRVPYNRYGVPGLPDNFAYWYIPFHF